MVVYPADCELDMVRFIAPELFVSGLVGVEGKLVATVKLLIAALLETSELLDGCSVTRDDALETVLDSSIALLKTGCGDEKVELKFPMNVEYVPFPLIVDDSTTAATVTLVVDVVSIPDLFGVETDLFPSELIVKLSLLG